MHARVVMKETFLPINLCVWLLTVQLLRIDLGLSQKHECLMTTIPDASQGMRCYWATLTLPLGIRSLHKSGYTPKN